MKKYGLQLYSIRDITSVDFNDALNKISSIGYSFVESAGFFNHDAKVIKSFLKNNNLELCSTHTSYKLLQNDFDNVVNYHLELGCLDIVIPLTSCSNKHEVDEVINNINKWIPLLSSKGIRLHYHNHFHEFIPNQDGIIPIVEILTRTKVFLELDTYWAYVAGVNPIEFMNKHNDRIKFIHLKDGTNDKIGKALGDGIAPITEILKHSYELNKIIIVESEGLNPTGIDEVTRCINYLKKTY